MTDREAMDMIMAHAIPESRQNKAKRLHVELDMLTPPGKTCGDCKRIKICVSLGVTKPESESCDWSPSLFILNDKEP